MKTKWDDTFQCLLKCTDERIYLAIWWLRNQLLHVHDVRRVGASLTGTALSVTGSLGHVTIPENTAAAKLRQE